MDVWRNDLMASHFNKLKTPKDLSFVKVDDSAVRIILNKNILRIVLTEFVMNIFHWYFIDGKSLFFK